MHPDPSAFPPSPPELTTVATREAVVFEAGSAHRHEGLTPDREHEVDGFSFRTLPEPGELLCTFATVNDVHFGEQVCGLIDGSDVGPVFEVPPGETPFPEVMNRAAIREIEALDPVAVLVKGDLTSGATQPEIDAFRAAYEGAFGDRLTVVRGNHESYHRNRFAAEPFQVVEVEGATLVVIDTSIDGEVHGTVTDDQLEELDELAACADRPVLVFGHHHLGDPDAHEKADRTFGIDLEASARFLEAVARRPRIRGYFAGHTHRNRVRRFGPTGDVPWVEVACVKDYPGMWAEYRVHEGAILQIVHRIDDPDALVWTEATRHMYHGLYRDYALGRLDDRCFAISI